MSVPERVAVIGGGRMGAGIAHAFLMAGAHVTVIERDDEAAAAAQERVEAAVAASVQRGLGRPAADTLVVTTDWQRLRDAALVIEAVPEDRELKVEALRRAEDLLLDDAVLATNTSSISIDDLATGIRRPSLFLGLHFFNPVPPSALVEVVVGTATDPAVVAKAEGWVGDLDKTPVTVKDSPGFASSRLGVLLGLEAIRMLEEGVASADDIDAAMVLGYKHPLGPLRLTDLVGLDVRLGVAEYLSERLGPRFEPPELLRRLVAEGHLGRKTGRGFYEWPSPAPTAPSPKPAAPNPQPAAPGRR
ncbi:3-hydroxyacyl-CoA dehydrogenase family protein [Leifsonia sp. NPDC058248]|uniref:3-hydroxyacyl-CoA dehydrogenase family protein n=1 Tax=Leifsonia sp. NPDC058248 TaxID=3346402 RepID=UPI0036DB7F8F